MAMRFPWIAADATLKELVARMAVPAARPPKGEKADGAKVLHATGLWGSSAPMVAAAVATAGRTLLYVAAHLEEADKARDDLEFFAERRCDLFPAWESLPGEGAASGEIEAERLRLCWRFPTDSPVGRKSPSPPIIVAPIQALMQPVPGRAMLEANTIQLSVGRKARKSAAWNPDRLLAWAVERGFARLELVESPGDVARRGDIVDLFVPGETTPFRLEFFGDDLESIRRFDIGTQRSLEALDSISVTALGERRTSVYRTSAEAEASGAVACWLDYLPPDMVIVLDAPAELQEMGQTIERRLGDDHGLFPVRDILGRIGRFDQLHLSRFPAAGTRDEQVFPFSVSSVHRFEGSATDVVQELARVTGDHRVIVVCENEGERQRLVELLEGLAPASAKAIDMPLGLIHRGFAWQSPDASTSPAAHASTVVLPHHELFGRQRQRRRIRRLHAGRPLESWTDLKPGELVVHVVHGIGVYRGLHRMRKGKDGPEEEFLTLEFAEKTVLHVPTSQIDLVQKYIGAAGHRPKLSTIGGKRWGKTKEQVAESVTELADSLLRLQADRARAEGTAYPPDTPWQKEFETAFPYEETEDQLIVADEVSEDLVRPRPMDRLLCGDVGYGKTELAMRAAFKVVEYGRQVAVLVPTTVLAEQHYETFRQRFADFPFTVDCLSRFRSPAEQKRILGALRKGQVDMVIGTHRLLSRDVAFANLGLVIIDEEQRFGVEHKERLKAMRSTVDVLTLTATPIPRTLHMSMMGLRDISSLQTPPVDRRAIATEVRPFDEELIRNAVLRELNRDGQVFFVHNFVQSIAGMADRIAGIVPEARIVFAHGQMKDGELEERMHRFVAGEADILVCTTIVESGIDLPRANTIFINRADRFGLADLHQLRGRVGRSDHRAYCYLLLSPDRTLTHKAAKRLKTIEEFSDLGAGFRIAMRDLEIRGAGNLLGKEQSGHIAAVGYEMYCRLLDQTVRRMRNEPDPNPPPIQLDIDAAAPVPSHYIVAERSRLEIYRRMAACRTSEEVAQLERDLADAFGPPPPPVLRLLELAEIRVLARRFGIVAISRREPDIVFTVEQMAQAEPLFVDAPGSVRMPDARTIHLRLPPSYLESGTLVPVLRRMLQRASSPAKTKV